MKLLLLLLVLGLELTLVCVHAEEKTSLTGKNFNPEKIVGECHSILLASDKREMIEEHGSMRVFVKSIHLFKNSSLAFKFHTIVNGECTELYVVCDKTEEDGVYEVICRKPELSSNIKEMFGVLCKENGIVKENILDLTEANRCLQARDGRNA
ncbi:major urinary protein 4-like precursor [Mesocricetus auratus]|uniref:Major urinary protein 4-like precursor n=1 Tax=Mesocricetus auratus TaxID=10036 RepID=T2B8G4_MESAU|nr:major urinary protein 4-like precursor [Mesocricetus auratus]AGV07609.1 truncated major urinary protein-like lipocalin 1 [Mesocricetus auratus]